MRCSDARFSCPFGSTCRPDYSCDLNGVTSAITLNVDPLRSTSGAGNICGPIINNFNIPNFCQCQLVHFPDDPRSRGGRVTCLTGLPSTVVVTAQAVFMPCSSVRPSFFRFFASADSTVNVGQDPQCCCRCALLTRLSTAHQLGGWSFRDEYFASIWIYSPIGHQQIHK